MGAQAQEKEKLWTPANIVTLLRICGVPVFVVTLISPWPAWFGLPDAESWKEWVAAGIFIVLAATDGLDGYLARSRGEITNFGKFMDPLADKILVAAALLVLIELSVLPSWVALIILCREFIVSGIRMVAATQGVVIAASWYGKAKTVAQIIAIVLFIIKGNHMVSDFSAVLSDRLYLISWVVMAVALILTIVSMLDYFAKARHLLGFENNSEKSRPGKAALSGNSAQEAEGGGRSAVGRLASDEGGAADDKVPADPLLVEPVLAAQSLDSLAGEVIDSARSLRLSLGTAESCTGGMIAARLTAIAGSSDAVAGGIVSYSNEVKQRRLGVLEETLAAYGAVSEQTACEMAEGARKSLAVDTAVSVTGIAGPDGGSPDKPVGTVWIGIADAGGVSATCHRFRGNREEIRLQTVREALLALRGALTDR